MYSIEVDFEVYKALTAKRATEDVNYNDVLRTLLELDPAPPKATSASTGEWVCKGVRFPAGTEFRAVHKGREYNAAVEAGGLRYNGELFNSPSAVAVHITGNPVNGWVFWQARFPGTSRWQLIKGLRSK